MALVPSMQTKMAIADELLELRLDQKRWILLELTKEEPQVEADDNHDNAKYASSREAGTDGHVPKHNAKLLVGK
jgi:hypothetical protein